MNYLNPCSAKRPLLTITLALSVFTLACLVKVESAMALEEFASFDAKLIRLVDQGRQDRDRLNFRGSFTLGTASNGINPVAEAVEVIVKGSGNSTVFSQSIPPGSFRDSMLGRKRKRFVFMGTKNGYLDIVRITQNQNGVYSYHIRGNGLNFNCCLDKASVIFIIGDDGGALDARTKTQIPLNDSIPPTISGLDPAKLSIPLNEIGTLTAHIQEPDPNRNMTIVLNSSNADIARVPSEIIVPPGKASTEVPVTGVTEGGPVVITASLNDTSAMSEIKVVRRPPPPVITEPLVEGSTMVGGTGVPGASIDIDIDGQAAGMGIVDPSGVFDVSVPALVSGSVVEATQMLNGLASNPSAQVTVVPIPPAPMVTPPLVEGMTIVSGKGVPEAIVDVLADSLFFGQGTVLADGNFSIDVPALVAGQEVTATQTVAGVTSIPSEPITVVEKPSPPIITTPVVAGSSTIAGTAMPGATVEVLVDSVSVGTALVNDAGTWNLLLATPLVVDQEVQAKQTVYGVMSALSDPITVVAPPPPPIINPPLVAGSTGITGTATNGASVEVFVDNVSVGNTIAGATGAWSLMISQPLESDQVVEATQMVGGLTSDRSDPVTVQSPPPPPTVDTPIIAGSTNVSGTGAIGAVVEVLVDNVSVGTTTVNASITWMLSLAEALTENQVVQATQKVNGITSDPSTPVTVVQPPPPPTINSPLFAGNTTVRGTGLPNASVEVFVDGTSAGSTAVTSEGNWALPLGTPLEAGQEVTAIQTEAGIPSPSSPPVIVEEAVVESIEITPAPEATIEVGQTEQFSASGTLTDGTVQDPLEGVTWTSDDPSVATIDESGLATGIGPGSAAIHASKDGVDSPTTTLTVTGAAPTITNFTPTSSSIGESITINGENLTPITPGALSVTLAQQGGGRIDAPITTSNDTTIIFTVPTAATTGNLEVTIDQQTVQVPPPMILTIVPSSTFSLNLGPESANLIQGQSISYKVSLNSNTGFTQLATLSVANLPSGVSAVFKPRQISAGQISILTVNAPAGQPQSSENLTISAKATVDGIELEETGNATLNIQPVTTSFLGRTVVADALQTPLVGVTVTFLGQDGSGNATGCSGQTISDGAGNFALSNLPIDCTGGQLVRFNGATATSPAGTYAGVDKFYSLSIDEVTKPPVLVHLPRIDNADTVMVQQNSPADQTITFPNIPNLAVTVYAGTTFTLENGSQPNPFPLTAVEIPLDRLPGGNIPPSDEGVVPMLVGFQPANTTASQPAAVFYPHTLNSPPGTSVPLLTLDPTLGIMVEYGTGTISDDGGQIVPDPDPANPGKRFGLTHLGWHGFVTALIEGILKALFGSAGGCKGEPVSLPSGLQVLVETDLMVEGQRGRMAIQRNYRAETNVVGPFGIGTFHNYSHRVNIARNTNPNSPTFTLSMPDGNQIPFTRRSNGTWTNETVPAFQGSVMTLNSEREATVKLKDCSTLHFVPTLTQQGSFLESVADANGNTLNLIRDPQNPVRINEVVDPVGRKLLLEYDDSDRITKVTDPIGRTVTYTYNAQDTLETVTNPEGGVTRYDYDAENRMFQITDARGVVVAQITYGANGRVVQEIQADGGVLEFDYTFLNPQVATSPVLTTEFTDPLGRTSVYRYNPQTLLVQFTDPSGQTTAFEREPGTNLLLSRKGNGTCEVCGDPRQGDITNTYDANGNLLSIANSLNHTTGFTYDPIVNKPTSVTDPLNHQAQMTYDSKGNFLTSTDQNGGITTFSYNELGLLTTITDSLGEITTMGYDDEGNLVTVTDALGNVTTFEYDAISRRVATIDALGRRTTLNYDKLNRVVSSKDAIGNITTFTYDEVDNLLTLTDAKNHTTTFNYDVMNRLATRTDPLGQTETFEYDLVGNLIRYTDRRGHVSRFAYDELDRLITENYEDGNVVTRGYDHRGRLAEVESFVTNQGPSPIEPFTRVGFDTFFYDAVGRLTREASFSGSLQYTYDARGQMLTRQVNGQPTVTYSYDPGGNLLNAAMPEAGVAMTYDARNQLANITRTNGVTSDYTYDPVGRLLSIVHANGPATIDTQTYVYDAVGNRINHSIHLAQPLITQPATSTFDDNNRLLTRNSTTYTYDANGNRATETDATGTKTYTWNTRNRLLKIEGPQSSIDFRYDFAGILVQQTTTENNSAVTQDFLLDDLTNVVRITRSDGEKFSILTGQTIDSHFAVSQANGDTQFSVTDALNSTVATVNQSGVQTATMNYEPYGETTTSRAYPFQYTGRVPVSKNLYYYRARFYDPQAGRFINEDLVGLAGKDVNLTRYVGNNPLSRIDPLGLTSVAEFEFSFWDQIVKIRITDVGLSNQKIIGTVEIVLGETPFEFGFGIRRDPTIIVGGCFLKDNKPFIVKLPNEFARSLLDQLDMFVKENTNLGFLKRIFIRRLIRLIQQDLEESSTPLGNGGNFPGGILPVR